MSAESTAVRVAVVTLTIGASPVTVMVSSRPPICICASMMEVPAVVMPTSSWMTVANPGRVNVTE